MENVIKLNNAAVTCLRGGLVTESKHMLLGGIQVCKLLRTHTGNENNFTGWQDPTVLNAIETMHEIMNNSNSSTVERETPHHMRGYTFADTRGFKIPCSSPSSSLSTTSTNPEEIPSIAAKASQFSAIMFYNLAIIYQSFSNHVSKSLFSALKLYRLAFEAIKCTRRASPDASCWMVRVAIGVCNNIASIHYELCHYSLARQFLHDIVAMYQRMTFTNDDDQQWRRVLLMTGNSATETFILNAYIYNKVPCGASAA